ncbi:MAG: class I SAM-dependent methyltransferase [Anaerolineaceae bacterium]|nr:class I SAM-dependent methyltransferase [Anaerolineaceae bacterium]
MSVITSSFFEPTPLEVKLTLGLGKTLLSPYYHAFARSLNLGGSERVLDFGSGSGICSGHIAELLKPDGYLDCVDISRVWHQVIQRTLKKYSHVNYYLGHLEKLHLPEDNYNLIVIHFVLHDINVKERFSIINKLSSLLKPDGRIIIREPQNHGLTLDEMENYTKNSLLNPIKLVEKSIWFLRVYDFILQNKG